jgi:hypothetical protein
MDSLDMVGKKKTPSPYKEMNPSCTASNLSHDDKQQTDKLYI